MPSQDTEKNSMIESNTATEKLHLKRIKDFLRETPLIFFFRICERVKN